MNFKLFYTFLIFLLLHKYAHFKGKIQAVSKRQYAIMAKMLLDPGSIPKVSEQTKEERAVYQK